MRVGIVGAGHIGGGIARQLAQSGHQLTVSFARDPDQLAELARAIGATAASPKTAAEAEVVVFSVPWDVVDYALEATGSLSGRVVIDTTNQFSRTGALDLRGKTGARFNSDRMTGALYTKCFNTLTASFQAVASERPANLRVVQWIAGDDATAKEIVAQLVTDAGFVPVNLATIDGCAVMEAPRRPGSVYGEEYRQDDVAAVLDAVGRNVPIPPPPKY